LKEFIIAITNPPTCSFHTKKPDHIANFLFVYFLFLDLFFAVIFDVPIFGIMARLIFKMRDWINLDIKMNDRMIMAARTYFMFQHAIHPPIFSTIGLYPIIIAKNLKTFYEHYLTYSTRFLGINTTSINPFSLRSMPYQFIIPNYDFPYYRKNYL